MRESHFTLATPYQPGHEQAQRRALMFRQRLAVQRVDDHRIGGQRHVAREASPERLIELDLLLAEVGFLFAVIGAEEDHFVAIGFEAGFLEHLAKRHAGPAAIAREALNTPAAVAGALKAGRDLVAAHGLELVHRERLRMIHLA